MSLMTGEPRAADIVTLRPTLVLEIKEEVVEIIRKDNVTFSDQISIVLALRAIELSDARLSGQLKSADVKKLSNIITSAIIAVFH